MTTRQRRPDLTRFATFFQAISHEVRQRILVLLEVRERSVGELVAAFDVSQPTISRHLAVLKHAGIVTSRREGQQIYYALDEEGLRGCVTQFFSRFSCCAALLGRDERGKR